MRPVLCPVLVGRDGEMRHLRGALDAASTGRGRTALLVGEAGIGKSRLARELSAAARQQGLVVLTGRAVAGQVPVPFRPFAEALSSALRVSGMPEPSELGPLGPPLARLVPEWRHLRGRPDGHQQPEDDSPVLLGESVLRLLRVLSPDQGCLFVLEDLHWADRETLALLEYMADNIANERVLCLGTLRADEGAQVRVLASLLEARGSADIVPLGRLDLASASRMAEACLGAPKLPQAVEALVAERAEGIPFLVEEVLAGLVGDAVLVERDGRWQTTGPVAAGVPATFADAVQSRLEAVDADSRRVICAAAVIGRSFDWALLGPVTGLADDAVLAALRRAVGLQLIAVDDDGFRFRHALTHEAVLVGLLPPERAMLAGRAAAAVEAAHPGLQDAWCELAADLSARAGDASRAGALLLEAGRRSLAVGALASAEQMLTRARQLIGPQDRVLSTPVDEALTEVFAMSGQVDRAIELGEMLLARLDAVAPPARAAELHLRLARAAIAAGKWAEAAVHVDTARAVPQIGVARIDACAAQLAVGQGRLDEAGVLASAALEAAERDGLAEVACEALEVIGRVARQRDLSEAERAFTRAASIARAHGLQLWRLRALHELGTIDQLRTESVDRLLEARELAAAQGALALTATLDLQIAAGLNKQFRADEALDTARRCVRASRRFRLATLPMALIFQATAHAIRGEAAEMEARIAEAMALAPDEPDVAGCAWGHCRATFSVLDEDRELAYTQMETGAAFLLGSPATIAPPFLGLWPLLGAALGRDCDPAAALVRASRATRHCVVATLLGYADAVVAGRAGRSGEAEAAFAAADAEMGPLVAWYRHYSRRLVAEAALTDGWGEPVAWLSSPSAPARPSVT